MRTDISDERGAGWVRVTCDAPMCAESLEGQPGPAEAWPAGWARDLRDTPLGTGEPRDYCPDHIAIATA